MSLYFTIKTNISLFLQLWKPKNELNYVSFIDFFVSRTKMDNLMVNL